ncbi:hypothetical protein DC366_04515 [Pelagivirga sediminicola]|uniref:Beta-ketoacyl synthase N-terminal domain-containing protein n=1 Tax=Pelagivirga sediminicola TaxID=2170575 RepID=A0A2T7G9E9_9RHOB|nr:hypothetical protein [Pelagivirga sediminicola]PVA11041.1 hypothetical protein DC366_04515 [Pelagivirga sediminicola]
MRQAIVAMGVATAFGPGLKTTVAALTEGRTPLRRQRSFIGADFRPQLTAFDAFVTHGTLDARLRELAGQALDDLTGQLQGVAPSMEDSGFRVAICGPRPDALTDPQKLVEDLTRLATQTVGCRAQHVAVHLDGPAAMVSALEAARADALAETPILLVSVDSYNDRARLGPLADQGLLFSNRTPYGFVPGEGAVALMLRMVGECQTPGPDDSGLRHSPGSGSRRRSR